MSAVLMMVVVGTVAVALTVDVAVVIGYTKRRYLK
jgi:hypothetical protein